MRTTSCSLYSFSRSLAPNWHQLIAKSPWQYQVEVYVWLRNQHLRRFVAYFATLPQKPMEIAAENVIKFKKKIGKYSSMVKLRKLVTLLPSIRSFAMNFLLLLLLRVYIYIRLMQSGTVARIKMIIKVKLLHWFRLNLLVFSTYTNIIIIARCLRCVQVKRNIFGGRRGRNTDRKDDADS